MTQPEFSAFLERTIEFTALLNRVRRDGYLESFQASLYSNDEYSIFVRISGTGYLPDDKSNMRRGIAPFCDTQAILEEIKRQTGDNPELVSASVEIRIGEWSVLNLVSRKKMGLDERMAPVRVGEVVNLKLECGLQRP